MLDISNNNIITMSRGDDNILPLHLFYGTNDRLTNYSYFPNRHDKIFFAIMEPNQPWEKAIFKKAYTMPEIYNLNPSFDKDGIIKIKLKSTDTEFLQPDTYYYMVKLLKKDPFDDTDDREGKVETVVEKTRFVII